MNAAVDYLKLSPGYAEYLGGLRWSARENLVEYESGPVFAFAEEVALFVEGFAARRPLIHFMFLLHLMEMVKNPRSRSTPGVRRLAREFAGGGHSLRNAGSFLAELCEGVPWSLRGAGGEEVCSALHNAAAPVHLLAAADAVGYYRVAGEPPLGPEAFERRILEAARGYSDDDLRAWFRTGAAPVRGAAAAVAQQVDPPPTLLGRLAALLNRPRLAAARALVADLAGALTLPRPRPAGSELPTGGYADVMTRGHVDHLLPSQFALDDWDFFRRFAESELLYFRREDPHTPARRETVVVLDQGVRTWGEVRLVLAAALLALGKNAAARGLPFLLATTGNEGRVVSPPELGEEEFGALVERSDLTVNPGLTLERVLSAPADLPRDVVLLTHRRAVAEADVRAAARLAGGGARLFAVALDGSGRLDVAEFRQGAPVTFRTLAVDLSRLHPPPPREEAEGPRAVYPAWSGDVEPVGYPFRFGLTGPLAPDLMDFDHGREWLLTVCQGGVLHAWRLDGTGTQILPRGLHKGEVLTQPTAVLGVAGGFAVFGVAGRELVVFHYDLRRRRCRAHPLPGVRSQGRVWAAGAMPQAAATRSMVRRCSYFPGRHAVLFDPWLDATGYAVYLDDGRVAPGPGGADFGPDPGATVGLPPGAAAGDWFHASVRTYDLDDGAGEPAAGEPDAIWDEYRRAGQRSGRLWLYAGPQQAPPAEHPPYCAVNVATGAVRVHDGEAQWPEFTPLADGRPVLRDCEPREAHCRGGVLALQVRHAGRAAHCKLYLFRGPGGALITEYFQDQAGRPFVLAPDGAHLAYQTSLVRVRVDTLEPKGLALGTQHGGFPQRVEAWLGGDWLTISPGESHVHTARWGGGPLELGYARVPARPARPVPGERPESVPAVIRHDRTRFVQVGAAGGRLLTDRFGHVVLLHPGGAVAAIFLAFRNRMGVWLPDGTRLGDEALTGGPPTPGAARLAADAVRRALAEWGET